MKQKIVKTTLVEVSIAELFAVKSSRRTLKRSGKEMLTVVIVVADGAHTEAEQEVITPEVAITGVAIGVGEEGRVMVLRLFKTRILTTIKHTKPRLATSYARDIDSFERLRRGGCQVTAQERDEALRRMCALIELHVHHLAKVTQ